MEAVETELGLHERLVHLPQYAHEMVAPAEVAGDRGRRFDAHKGQTAGIGFQDRNQSLHQQLLHLEQECGLADSRWTKNKNQRARSRPLDHTHQPVLDSHQPWMSYGETLEVPKSRGESVLRGFKS